MSLAARCVLVRLLLTASLTGLPAALLSAQPANLAGTVKDETGAPLNEVVVQMHAGTAPARQTMTDNTGGYQFANVTAGPVRVSFAHANFGLAERRVSVPEAGTRRLDVTLQLALSADLTVLGKSTL